MIRPHIPAECRELATQEGPGESADSGAVFILPRGILLLCPLAQQPCPTAKPVSTGAKHHEGPTEPSHLQQRLRAERSTVLRHEQQGRGWRPMSWKP